MDMVMNMGIDMVTGIDMVVWAWVRVRVRVIPIHVRVTIHPITSIKPAWTLTWTWVGVMVRECT